LLLWLLGRGRSKEVVDRKEESYEPFVSLIIPAHNEEKNIAVCLNSLFSQEKMPDEIVVINDASTDGTENIVKVFAAKYRNLKLVNRTKSQGYTQVILTGIKHAKGDIIAIFDADSVAPRLWIKNLLIAFRNKRIGCAGGAYFPGNTQKWIPFLEDIYMRFKYSFNSKKNNLAGTNLAFDRKKAEQIRLFAESPAFSIDKYIQEKMKNAGYAIKFLKNNPVRSNAPETIKAYVKQWLRWGKGLAARKESQIKKIIISSFIILLLPLLILFVYVEWKVVIIYCFILVALTLGIYAKMPRKPNIIAIPLMLTLKYLGLLARSFGYFKFLLCQK
jgi:glycosyltransferase involved in cell wall biosynthesis